MIKIASSKQFKLALTKIKESIDHFHNNSYDESLKCIQEGHLADYRFNVDIKLEFNIIAMYLFHRYYSLNQNIFTLCKNSNDKYQFLKSVKEFKTKLFEKLFIEKTIFGSYQIEAQRHYLMDFGNHYEVLNMLLFYGYFPRDFKSILLSNVQNNLDVNESKALMDSIFQKTKALNDKKRELGINDDIISKNQQNLVQYCIDFYSMVQGSQNNFE